MRVIENGAHKCHLKKGCGSVVTQMGLASADLGLKGEKVPEIARFGNDRWNFPNDTLYLYINMFIF